MINFYRIFNNHFCTPFHNYNELYKIERKLNLRVSCRFYGLSCYKYTYPDFITVFNHTIWYNFTSIYIELFSMILYN